MSIRNDILAVPDADLRAGNVAGAALVFMDFLDAPKRWWTGFGDLDAGGQRWQGTGDFIGISEIDTAYDLSAGQVTFTVAPTPEMLANALNAKSRVRDRAVTVSMQLFQMQGQGADVQPGQPLGPPFVLFTGTMQRMPWSATGTTQRSLTVEAEGLFFRRNAPPRGRWTDADQKARWPGDRGLERLPLYASSAGYTTRWL